MGCEHQGQKIAEARKEGEMIEQRLPSKPNPNPIPYNEKLRPSPLLKQPLQQPESGAELATGANAAIAKYLKPTGLRHSYGKGIPAGHEALGGE